MIEMPSVSSFGGTFLTCPRAAHRLVSFLVEERRAPVFGQNSDQLWRTGKGVLRADSAEIAAIADVAVVGG